MGQEKKGETQAQLKCVRWRQNTYWCRKEKTEWPEAKPTRSGLRGRKCLRRKGEEGQWAVLSEHLRDPSQKERMGEVEIMESEDMEEESGWVCKPEDSIPVITEEKLAEIEETARKMEERGGGELNEGVAQVLEGEKGAD